MDYFDVAVQLAVGIFSSMGAVLSGNEELVKEFAIP